MQSDWIWAIFGHCVSDGDDDEEELNCVLCMQSFWFKAQLLEHLKEKHNKAEPENYIKEKGKKILLEEKDLTEIMMVNKRNGVGFGAKNKQMTTGRGKLDQIYTQFLKK